MTPFGLRKRLKQALGVSNERAEIVTFPVTYVLPDGTEQVVHAEERYNLLMASEQLPAPISTGRRAGGPCPDGRCGSCHVHVLDATGLTPQKDFEQTTLSEASQGQPHEGRGRDPYEVTPQSRLACHTKIVGPGARVGVLALMDYADIEGEVD